MPQFKNINSWVKGECKQSTEFIKIIIMKILHMYQNLWNTLKAGSRGKCILLNYQSVVKGKHECNFIRFFGLYQQLIHWTASSLAVRKEL